MEIKGIKDIVRDIQRKHYAGDEFSLSDAESVSIALERASNADKAMLAYDLIRSCKPKGIELDLTSRSEAEDWLIVYINEME